MAVVQRNCINCGEVYPSKNSRSRYCSAACKSQHYRTKDFADKVVTIGRLSITFRHIGDDKSQAELEAIVESCLTPEMLAIIHSDQPVHTPGETHNA